MTEIISKIKIQQHPFWRAFDERFKQIENRLLSQKAVLTFDEAADFTGLSKSFLYKLTSTSRIPHFKPSGKNIYFDRLELENWLKSNPVKTKDEIEREAARYVTVNNGGKKL